MRLRASVVLLALVGGLAVSSSPASGDEGPTRVSDACGSVEDARKDLAAVTFGFNGEALQIGAETCAALNEPNGDWLITVHLTSFQPEVQITGLLQDVGRY